MRLAGDGWCQCRDDAAELGGVAVLVIEHDFDIIDYTDTSLCSQHTNIYTYIYIHIHMYIYN